jgi:hypothetical protein
MYPPLSSSVGPGDGFNAVWQLWLRVDPDTDHTSIMKLKNAAFLAVAGTALWTALNAVNLVGNISGVADGFIPAVTLLTSLIQFFAALSLLIFFTVFHRAQS